MKEAYMTGSAMNFYQTSQSVSGSALGCFRVGNSDTTVSV